MVAAARHLVLAVARHEAGVARQTAARHSLARHEALAILLAVNGDEVLIFFLFLRGLVFERD